MRLSFVIGCIVLSACASQVGAAPFDANLAGTWKGPASLVPSEGEEVSYAHQLTIGVSGNTARLSNICPTRTELEHAGLFNMQPASLGSGSEAGASALSAEGSGVAASWSGSLSCPQIAVHECLFLIVTFTNAAVILIGPDRLGLVMAGTEAGCKAFHSFMFTFVGTK
jgi:hypothetical protein